MSPFTSENATQIADACRANIDSIAQSYNANLSVNLKFAPGELSEGCDSILGQTSDQPGLFILFECGDQALVAMVPEAVCVPRWYRHPDENQAARLQTLPMEWSIGLLPDEIEVTKFQTIVCGNLKKQLTACGLDDDARRFEFIAINPVSSAELGRIQIVWPLNTARFQNVADFVDEHPAASASASGSESKSVPPPVSRSTSSRQARVLPVSVPLIVKIAEKRIDMRQLRTLAPGMLITFDKPYDDPLDVFIGRQLYCRGEAVKMGENFAIKINETGSEAIRPQVVHGL